MSPSISPEVVAHYEALRANGAGITTGTPAGRALLQRCGMITWAQTCNAYCSPQPAVMRRPSSLGDHEHDTQCTSPSPHPLADTVRDQVTLVLASMVHHHRPGGDHELASPTGISAAGVATPA